MSEATGTPLALPPGGWKLWSRQIGGILRLEIFKNLFGKRALPVYLLAAAPVLLMMVRILAKMSDDSLGDIASAETAFAQIYYVLFMRVVLYVGCVFIFISQFRGEVVDEILHYYFLTPVRREVLTAGKFLAGVIATAGILSLSVAASYILLLIPHGTGATLDHLFSGPGLGHLIAYVGATTFACVGYGALFLTLGLVFRRILTVVLLSILLWGIEGINFLMPALLKKFSVIHYVQSLTPVPIDEGALALIAEPTSPWIAVPGLIVFAGVLLFISAQSLKRLEIRYEGE